MSFESDLYNRLSGDTVISSLVGTRIYPSAAPQNTIRPYCVYQLVNKPHIYSHSGYSGLSQLKVQLISYGDSYQDAKQVAAAVTSLMESWPGSQGCQSAFQSNESDSFEKETNFYRVITDFLLIYQEV